MEPSSGAVKEPKPLHKATLGRRRFAALWEGWELGAVAVSLVLAMALLAVPRPASPGIFPVPLLDVAEAAAADEHRAMLAAQAEREGLPFETRAVGDAIRRFGVALASGLGSGDQPERLMEERVRAALAAKQLEALLRLRAVQAQLFVRAVRAHHWNDESAASPELAALGGDFASRATRNGWAGPDGCSASDGELALLFERRWLELTRLRSEPRFKPTLAEQRRYYRFLLLHPERSGSSTSASERARVRLRYVDALARYDTEYPAALARGSLLGAAGELPESARWLSRHLGRPGSAAWNLRARNYLLEVAGAGIARLGPTEGAEER